MSEIGDKIKGYCFRYKVAPICMGCGKNLIKAEDTNFKIYPGDGGAVCSECCHITYTYKSKNKNAIIVITHNPNFKKEGYELVDKKDDRE